jgi:hypothetical protein
MAKKRPATDVIPSANPIAPVIKQAQLSDLRLLSCKVSHPNELNLPPELNQHVSVHGSLNKDKEVLVIARFALSGNSPSPSGEPVALDDEFYIEARFGVTYTLQSTEGITQDQVVLFAQQNGIFNLWPYWREFVQSMTCRMSIEPLRVPLLKSPLAFGSGKAASSKAAGKGSKPKRKSKQ